MLYLPREDLAMLFRIEGSRRWMLLRLIFLRGLRSMTTEDNSDMILESDMVSARETTPRSTFVALVS